MLSYFFISLGISMSIVGLIYIIYKYKAENDFRIKIGAMMDSSCFRMLVNDLSIGELDLLAGQHGWEFPIEDGRIADITIPLEV